METVVAPRPLGRKTVREIAKKRAVAMEYLPAQDAQNWEEVYEKGLDMLSAHYGVDMRALKLELK